MLEFGTNFYIFSKLLRSECPTRLCCIPPSHLAIHSSQKVRMSMNSANLTITELELPEVLTWTILSKGFGFVSGPFGWLCAAVLLTGFFLAQSQQQISFRKLCDKDGNKIPNGPKPLPILGKPLSQVIVTHQTCETIVTESNQDLSHSLPSTRNSPSTSGQKDSEACIQYGSATNCLSLFRARRLPKISW